MRRHEKSAKYETQPDDDELMDCIDEEEDEIDIRQQVRIEFGTRRSDEWIKAVGLIKIFMI